MVSQGISALIFHDNITSLKIAKCLKTTCKASLAAYIILFLIRLGMFFDIHSQVKMIDQSHEDKGIGSFFAEYIDDMTGSILISLLILFLFFAFYASNFWMISVMTKMIDFIQTKNQDLEIEGPSSDPSSRRDSEDSLVLIPDQKQSLF